MYVIMYVCTYLFRILLTPALDLSTMSWYSDNKMHKSCWTGLFCTCHIWL